MTSVPNRTPLTEVASVARAAAAAAPRLQALGRDVRARLLITAAEELEKRRDEIVAAAHEETHIPSDRLGGELSRTTYQLRLFAEAVGEGSFLEAAVDHAGDTPMGPGPDLRRMLVPLGPVAVFGASNFPLAFSVPGGDTASALAAGCPVVVKAHSSHPRTSRLAFEALSAAAQAVGAPEGTVGIVFGQEAGAALVADPHIKAVGFTGSLSGGQALQGIIAARPEPIPFYGELSSLNPLVVTRRAAAARGGPIAEGLVTSFTVSAGQLCTKPGLVLVPTGTEGDALVAAMADTVRGLPASRLLNDRIAGEYAGITAALRAHPAVTVAAEAAGGPGPGAAPLLLEADAAGLDETVTRECFGPVTVVARYGDEDTLLAALAALPGSLTATLHAEPEDRALAERVLALLAPRAGRLVFDGFPTGVLVSWAQHHGGPWPSTTAPHTSVGTTAMRRFLRPMVWQNAPEAWLPAELRDGPVGIPRRVDGALTLPV
ncbi:aldehyde dehydrogenase (NADP(+)) [Streptomyces sp. NPDC007818]|uniref:aldehyde dehydrogenase (NADP(+)) n=1 Tax=Streptomyces sp. NPDC007818 TaxID=3364780 RepID=UPI0036C29E83